jgi:siroheme synthase
VPAYAGIPLTHRLLSSSVTVLTGARAGDGSWTKSMASAAASDTIVVLMGMTHLRNIAAELIAAGRPESTPTAVIRWGSYESQRTITGTLLTIADEADREGMRAPAVIVIGEVVRLREQLKWFQENVTEFECESLDFALT